MGKFGKIILSLTTLLTGGGAVKAQDSLLTPEQFMMRFIEAFDKALPESQFEINGQLVVTIKSDGHVPWTVNLQRPYADYKLQPESLDELITRYVEAHLERVEDPESLFGDLANLVPLVRCRAYLEDARNVIGERKGDPALGPVHRDLNEELVVLYAFDGEKSFAYLTQERFAMIDLDPDDLFAMAMANLTRVLPQTMRYPVEGGGQLITAGGDFDASLLLFDEMWEDGQLGLDGVPIVALPARDLLLVAGSNDPEAIANLRNLVNEAEQKVYPFFSDKLFIRRDHRWEVYQSDSTADQGRD